MAQGNAAVMVCLISRQTMQNLLPIVQQRPQRVVFLTTRQEDASRQTLEAVLADMAMPVDPPRYVDAYEPASTLQACREVLAQYGAAALTANLTGGTKVMSLAAFRVFAEAGVPCLYTDTPNRRLLSLYPDDRAPEPLQAPVDVLTYLKAHGQHAVLREATSRRSLPTLAAFIGQHISQLNPFLSRLRLAMRDSRNKRDPNCVRFDLKGKQRSAKAAELLQLALQAELATARPAGKQQLELTFPDDTARRYLEGDWLEDLVFETVKQCGFDQVASNIGLRWQDAPEREMNEIDVAVVHNLRFFYVSCKSGGDVPQMKQHLYELESLAALAGGLFNAPILVASSGKAVSAALQQRMNTLGIAYIGPNDLPQLAARLTTIIR